MLSHTKFAFAVAASLSFAAAAGAQTPVKWTATATKPAAAGGETSVKLSAKIDDGWHIYSITQGPGGPIPTKVSVPDSQAFALAGQVKSSAAPAVKFDENFGINVETYEKAVDLTVPVKVQKGAKAGEKTGIVAVRYQACNASLCLPPKTEKIKVALNVKSGK
jgi:DsbC/DsbD-like thiol-disulfide interchange protein